MLVFLIFLIIFLIALIVTIFLWNKDLKDVTGYTISAILFFSLCLTIGLGVAGCGYCISENIGIEKQQMIAKYEMLEYRLEMAEDSNIIEETELFEQINDYNNKVIRSKRLKDNLWIGWYCNDTLADLKVISNKNTKKNKKE